MNELLKRLLMRGRVMAPLDEDQHVGGDDDLDDEDEDQEVQEPAKKPEVKLGDQEDGSVIIELEDGDDTKKESDEKAAGEEKSKAEGEDDEAALEEKRAARRQERQERKARQREREEASRRELAATKARAEALEQRLAALEGRDRSRELAKVESDIQRVESAYEQARAVYQDAIEQHDGEAATKAQETMLLARERYAQLNAAKEGFKQQQKAPSSGAADPVVTSLANKFMSDNPWYKHNDPKDTDSSILKSLDNVLANEGIYTPNQPEYWDELRARVKKYLPHRVAGGKVSTNAGKDSGDSKPVTPARQQKTVVGGGGGESQGAGKGVFHLSANRVQAMKDAGVWDDPKARAEMIRRYRDYDKENSKGN